MYNFIFVTVESITASLSLRLSIRYIVYVHLCFRELDQKHRIMNFTETHQNASVAGFEDDIQGFVMYKISKFISWILTK